MKAGEQLTAALDDLTAQRVDAASGSLAKLAGSDVDGVRASAKFSQANILLQKNDLKGAAAFPGGFRQCGIFKRVDGVTFVAHGQIVPWR